MSDFKAKMHQIQFGWGSAPDPAGELTALPRSHSWWGGGWLPPPQEPYPRSRPFGPRCSAPRTSVLSPSGLDVLAPSLTIP